MKSIKRNTILNAVQNICKILFPLITIPYASRVLQPANYGIVGFGNSIIRYFILLAGLGVSTYSQREAPAFRNDNNKFEEFSRQIFTINSISTIISYILFLLVFFTSQRLIDYRLLILIQSIAIVLPALGADWINVIYEDYLYITVRYILMQCVSLILLFALVKRQEDLYWYAAINILATTGGNLFNILYIRKYAKLKIVNPKSCIQHLRPVLILFCGTIATVIYVNSDITILGLFMRYEDVGIYTIVSNIYSVIKQLISAIITVSVPRLSFLIGNKMELEYKALAQSVLDSLISVLLPIISGLCFLSYHILNVMGGEQYLSGCYALVVLSFALFFAILAGFYSNVYLLLVKNDKLYLFATTLSAAINIGLNFLLIPKYGIISAAVTTLIAELSMSSLASYNALKIHHLLPKRMAILSAVFGSICVGIICYLIGLFHMSSILTIIVSVIVSIFWYCFVMRVFKNPITNLIEHMISNVWHKI